MRELEREAGCSIAAIQKELKKLRNLQLVLCRRNGNRLYCKANSSHPLYPEIHSLVQKTTGLPAVLAALFQSRQDIDLAFIFGSMANDSYQAESDLDLMIIGDITLRELSGVLAGPRQSIGREINPYILRMDEFRDRCQKGEHFVTSVMATPHIFVKGSKDDLAAVA